MRGKTEAEEANEDSCIIIGLISATRELDFDINLQ